MNPLMFFAAVVGLSTSATSLWFLSSVQSEPVSLVLLGLGLISLSSIARHFHGTAVLRTGSRSVRTLQSESGRRLSNKAALTAN
jgi:hypothetical protein